MKKKIKILDKKFTNPLLMSVFIFLLNWCEQSIAVPETEAASVLPKTSTIVGFNLNHPQLGKYDLNSIKGKWSLFFFGYARCPDVCPTELYMMAEMMRIIESNSSGEIQPPQVIFVSLDPQQDAQELLQQYASSYHSSFIGITGKQSTIDQLAKSMGVSYERVYHLNGRALLFDPQKGIPEGLENSYFINHSASIFLVNPNGKLHAIFSAPHQPDVMIRDIANIQKAWR